MTEREYERISKRLEANVAARTTLLTFSFTTVLAALGLAFTVDVDRISCLIFLIPYFLIVPFSARIAYLRIIYARMYSFLMVFAPDDMQFAIRGKQVKENDVEKRKKPMFEILHKLNNYELFLLAIASCLTFWCKYPRIPYDFTTIDWLICLLPVILTGAVGKIIQYGYAYNTWEDYYKGRWEGERNQQNTSQPEQFLHHPIHALHHPSQD